MAQSYNVTYLMSKLHKIEKDLGGNSKGTTQA